MIALRSSAKLNLRLEILGRRADGYHEIRSVVQTVSLWDDLVLRPGEASVEMVCNWPELETPDNLCVRAAQLLSAHAGVPCRARIELTKRIPLGAGLGGGSGNAASALVGLSQLWELDLPGDELAELAVKIGADVPLFLEGGTALMEGIGERLTPLTVDLDCFFVIAKGVHNVDTSWAYRVYDENPAKTRSRCADLIDHLRKNRVDKAATMIDNLLEPAVALRFPEVTVLKQTLLRHGAMGAAMTGSGAAVFGAFRSEAEARAACDAVATRADMAWIAQPTPAGIQFLRPDAEH